MPIRRLPTPPASNPEDFEHLIVADSGPLPRLGETEDRERDVLTRDVADQALCGWTLPGKRFSRIMWSDRPGSDICPDCVQAVIDRNLDRAALAVTPPECWDGWSEQD